MACGRRRTTDRTREGTVMVLFGLIMVAILAMVGVAIEMGLVCITRDRMQSAADSAAREILRERDYAASVAAEDDDPLRDHERRQRNSLFAPWSYDSADMLEAYEPSEQGAGHYHVLSDGQGDTNFGRMYPSFPAEKIEHSIPVLELNQDGSGGGSNANAPHGDIVAGAFTAEELGYEGNPIRLEDSEEYERVDFTPAAPLDAPYADSLLVRLRRTFSPGQPGNNPLDREAGISSSGWTLPLVFGGGSTIIGTNPELGYSIRHHGLRFRATAIAQGRTAVRAGLAHPEYGPEWGIGVGTMAFNVIEAYWDPWNYSSIHWHTIDNPLSEDYLSRYIVVKVWEDHTLLIPGDDDTMFGALQEREPRRVGDKLLRLPYDEKDDWWDQHGYEEEYWLTSEIYAPAFYEHWEPGVGRKQYIQGFFRVKTEIHIDPDTGLPVYDGQSPIPQIRLIVMANEMAPSDRPEAPWIAPRNASSIFDGLQNTELEEEVWEILIDNLPTVPGLIRAPTLVR